MSAKKNVTFIDELPDLEDLESNQHRNDISNDNKYNKITDIIPQEQAKYQKYIRNYTRVPPNNLSGMNPGQSIQQMQQMQNQQQILQQAYNNLPAYANVDQRENFYYNNDEIPHNEYIDGIGIEKYPDSEYKYNKRPRYRYNKPLKDEDYGVDESSVMIKEKYTPNSDLNCRDVAYHIIDCPVCSKIYNNDKTFYIATIVILVFIILALLQKLLQFYTR
jgi:hypothetical protein